jgi:hypothetical protein
MTRTTGGTDWGNWLSDLDGRERELGVVETTDAATLTADAQDLSDNVTKLSHARAPEYVAVLESSLRDAYGDVIERVEVVPGREIGVHEGFEFSRAETGEQLFPVAVRVEGGEEDVAHVEAFVPIPPGVAAPLVEGVLLVVGVAGTTAARKAGEEIGAAVVDRLRRRLLTDEERERERRELERRERERERDYEADYGFEE